MYTDIGIVGGGPAGYFAALAAAEANTDARVILLEATNQPLDKVRVSGGGRCNVTHRCFDPSELIKNYPRGQKELLGPFHRFQPQDTVAWFETRGVKLKVEPDGRMFPVTDNSETIIDCLRQAVRKAGIEIRLRSRVHAIQQQEDNNRSGFQVTLHDNSTVVFDRLLLATGSSPQGYRFAEALGHSIVPCVPSLFTFKIKDKRIESLSGISFDEAALTLTVGSGLRLKQSGPVLVTHWGLSGPAILKLSAWAARELNEESYEAELRVNFVPNVQSDELRTLFNKTRDGWGQKKVSSNPVMSIPKRYWQRIVHLSGIAEVMTWNQITRPQISSLTHELTDAEFRVRGKGIFKEEFVTCGGVNLKEVDFKNMQSKLCPGLHFAGEILDIDGITGGFNFQAAWTTGFIAGISMAETDAR